MTKDQLKELRSKAVQATRHRWFTMETDLGSNRKDVACSGREGTIAQHIRGEDADFIAAFSPLIAIELLDLIQDLQRQIRAVSPRELV